MALPKALNALGLYHPIDLERYCKNVLGYTHLKLSRRRLGALVHCMRVTEDADIHRYLHYVIAKACDPRVKKDTSFVPLRHRSMFSRRHRRVAEEEIDRSKVIYKNRGFRNYCQVIYNTGERLVIVDVKDFESLPGKELA